MLKKTLGDLNSLLEVYVSYNHFTDPVSEKWVKLVKSMPSSFLGNSGFVIFCQAGDSSCIMNSTLKLCSNGTNNPKGLSEIHVVMVVLVVSFLFFLVCPLLSCVLLRRKKAEAVDMPSLHQEQSNGGH